MANFFDFIDRASRNPTLGMRFLTEINDLKELKNLFEECDITDIPEDSDCDKILSAKKDLMDNINNVDKLASAKDKY